MAKLHSQHANVYFVCARCGCDRPLGRMRWQNGKLMCREGECLDSAIVGSRDIMVAREVSRDRKELQPDRKLTDAPDRRAEELDVLY